jgi:ADP-ribose pyrophosphatase
VTFFIVCTRINHSTHASCDTCAMPEPRPWTLLRTRAERDFRIFTAQTLDVTAPHDGAEYVRTVLKCPDWVNVVALTTEQRVILVRQFRFGTWSNTLEIPGGMVDSSEDPQAAAVRELEEETGFVPGSVVFLGTSLPNPALQTNRLHSYLARDYRPVHAGHQDASEDIEVVLVDRNEIARLVKSGEISHSLVLAALLFDAMGPAAIRG